jgi:transitional endoplasmic reticulum ATPase
MAETKQLLKENIVYAIERREAFEKVGLKPATGILLYGPPGTGKTMLARAVATECGANFIAIKGAALKSRWLGETEENIHRVFAKARALAPSVIFFDEMDAAVPRRAQDSSRDVDAAVNQILAEMDGIDAAQGVVVIGATNRVELMDPAVLRPGRFDEHIEVPLPDQAARCAIFRVHLQGKRVTEDVEVERLAHETQGFSGADIAEVVRDSAWSALRKVAFDPASVAVSLGDLAAAVSKVQAIKRRG